MDGSARSAHSWSDTVMDCQLVCDDHLLCQVETYLFFVFFRELRIQLILNTPRSLSVDQAPMPRQKNRGTVIINLYH